MWAVSLVLGCVGPQLCVVDQLDGAAALLETPQRELKVVEAVRLGADLKEGDIVPCDGSPQGAGVVANTAARQRPQHRALAHTNHKEERQ